MTCFPLLFDTHIISYEPPKGLQVPKLLMYDGTSDSFDHLIYFRQLMTLDIDNDVLLCKVFSASLYGLTLYWFNDSYRILLILFGCLRGLCRPLFMLYSIKEEYKHPAEHQDAGN